MNIFEELKPKIEAFQDARDRVVSKTSLPSTHGAMNCGEPPFAVDDGTNYYAVIDVDGQVKPLPFGYQIASDDMDTDGVDVIISTPMALDGSGMGMARYVPLVEDFEIPGERAFCLESAEDSDARENGRCSSTNGERESPNLFQSKNRKHNISSLRGF